MMRSSAHSRLPRCAFTLVELIVALTLGALAAASTAIVLSNASRTRDAAKARVEAFERAHMGATLIAGDAMNLARDSDLYFTRVLIGPGPGAAADSTSTELLIVSSLSRPTRATDEQAEGDEAEIHYRVAEEPAPPDAPVASGTPRPTALWRRIDSTTDETQDGGGVAAPIVDGVTSLIVEATDSSGEWYTDWDSDIDGLPLALRVTVTAADAAGRQTRTVRRIVAIDRAPLPGTSVVDPQETETQDTSATPSTGTETGATGSSTGGTAGGGGAGSGGGGGGVRRGGGGGGGGSPTPNPNPSGGTGGGGGNGGTPRGGQP